MNKKNTADKLSREQLEALLADYAVGKLKEPERSMVERSIASYPDLQQTVVEMMSMFARLHPLALRTAATAGASNPMPAVRQAAQAPCRNPLKCLQRIIREAGWKVSVPFATATLACLYIVSQNGLPGAQQQTASIDEVVRSISADEMAAAIADQELASSLAIEDEGELMMWRDAFPVDSTYLEASLQPDYMVFDLAGDTAEELTDEELSTVIRELSNEPIL